MPRRAGQWAAVVWAVLVAAGGGATVWLQSGETEPGSSGQRPGLVGPEAEPSPAVVSGDTDTCPEPPPHIVEEDSDGVFSWSCLESVAPPPPEEDLVAEDDHAPDPSPDANPPAPGQERSCPGDEPDDHAVVLCRYTLGE